MPKAVILFKLERGSQKERVKKVLLKATLEIVIDITDCYKYIRIYVEIGSLIQTNSWRERFFDLFSFWQVNFFGKKRVCNFKTKIIQHESIDLCDICGVGKWCDWEK